MLNIFTFLKQTKQELDKVEWPTKKQTAELTKVVIVVSVLIAVYIAFLDLSFGKLLSIIIK